MSKELEYKKIINSLIDVMNFIDISKMTAIEKNILNVEIERAKIAIGINKEPNLSMVDFISFVNNAIEVNVDAYFDLCDRDLSDEDFFIQLKAIVENKNTKKPKLTLIKK